MTDLSEVIGNSAYGAATVRSPSALVEQLD